MATSNPLTEKDFQRYIIDRLVEDDKYVERIAKTSYDPIRAMDVELLFDFFGRTQPDELAQLEQIYNGAAEATILNHINNDIAKRGLVQVLWTGVDFDGDITLDLVYPRPSALFDKKADTLYADNELSVMEEVYHKEDERIDLVIFLNGIAIFTIELKCNSAGTGWDYREAIRQYREERDCTTRLLMPKVGALAHFAMDLNEVYVCAELKGKDSTFLPFNQGVREGRSAHETEPGNPHNDRGINTAYMWEDIWTKDTVFDLIYDFIFIATKRDKKGKKTGEVPIFPRYQQLRAVRNVTSDIAVNGTLRDYLIEHSAGSGKTNTISWLAHKLSSLYQKGSDEPLFEKIIVATDRLVVDRQLQNAIMDMSKDTGIVRVMSKGTTSKDLSLALHKNYRIVVTTIQKFLNLEPGTFEGEDKHFAVLIDEAHGSTAGKSMSAMDATLSDGADIDSALDDVSRFIATDIARSGKQMNVSVIGFTATPTGRTLQQFGTLNEDGNKEAFDLYSMNQAIQEGFILDVTANYTTYDSYCKVVKAIQDDPELETSAAKRKLAHYISTSDGTVKGNLEVMIEHFTGTVQSALGGHAKGMIVTSSREAAVRYRLAFEEMRHKDMKCLGHVQALVAFTDSIEIDGETYTEAGMNGFSEDKLPEYFETDDYKLLIVADKYQTGFDQPYLAAMYVAKKLSGITAVQTLSRLNRICPPYEKRTFILDFANSFDDIRTAFSPYYKDTILTSPLTLSDVRETERRMMDFGILDLDDIEEFNKLLAKEKRSSRDKEHMWSLLDNASSKVRAMDENEADEVRRTVRNFIRQYAFLLQAAPFEDKRLHMEYNFCVSLIREINAGHGSGNDFSIADKVKLEEFSVEKGKTYEDEGIAAVPEIGIARGTGTGLSKDQVALLSEIIAEWNTKYGTHFDTKVAAGSLMSLKYTLEEDPKIQQSAKVNTKRDFKNTVDDQTEGALINNYEQNNDWYGFLLENEDARKQLIHAFVDDIYNGLKNNTNGQDK